LLRLKVNNKNKLVAKIGERRKKTKGRKKKIKKISRRIKTKSVDEKKEGLSS